jgi:NAD+ kinase
MNYSTYLLMPSSWHGCQDPGHKDVKLLHPADWIPASLQGRHALYNGVSNYYSTTLSIINGIKDMQQKQSFKRIALLGRSRHNHIEETLLALHEYLKQQGCVVIFENETLRHLLSQPAAEGIVGHRLHEVADLVIVVGGDGSMLQAAKVAVPQSLPVLGVNRGRLGFLTDIYPHEIEKIGPVLRGEYLEEHRFLLSAEVQHQNTIVAKIDALNEVVLSPGKIAHMIEFAVSVNGQFVCDFHADGLIVATPTGSTAYALSGGGPILHPSLHAVVLVPMFPHTLSNRPIVIDADSRITISIAQDNEAKPQVSGDGQKRFAIQLGDTLEVQKMNQPLRLIHPLDYNYFETLRVKLRWQSKN